MTKIVMEFKSWEDLRVLIAGIRSEVNISPTKITQILKKPGRCTNEELIILAKKLELEPATLLGFGLGKDRISQVEQSYHKEIAKLKVSMAA